MLEQGGRGAGREFGVRLKQASSTAVQGSKAVLKSCARVVPLRISCCLWAVVFLFAEVVKGTSQSAHSRGF